MPPATVTTWPVTWPERSGDANATTSVVLMGDSHAEHWLPAMDRIQLISRRHFMDDELDIRERLLKPPERRREQLREHRRRRVAELQFPDLAGSRAACLLHRSKSITTLDESSVRRAECS